MIEIRIAQLSETRPIVSMLNQATLDLMEKGIRQWRYPWSAVKVKHQIGLQQRYLLLQADHLLGSFTLASHTFYETFTLPTKALVLGEIILMPEAIGFDYDDVILEYGIKQAKSNRLDLYLASPVKSSDLIVDLETHHFELWDRSPSTYLYRYN